MEESRGDFQYIINELERACDRMRPKTKVRKSKVLVTGRDQRGNCKWERNRRGKEI